MKFFSVKDRKMVEVPDSQVRAVKYERITRSGKKQVRYALRSEYDGRRLIKFVDEATYRQFAEQAPQVFCSKLYAFARDKGVQWEQLSPKARAEFVLQNAEAIAQLDDLLIHYEKRIEPVLREAAAQCGLEWDKMSDDERIAFVAEWLDD
jgi:CHASE1-domain containing sensor protein